MTSLMAYRLRTSTDADRERIARIAELDSSHPIEGPALIGEIYGIAVAALSLEDGRVVADPFRHTADLVATMRAEARAMGAPRRARRGLLGGLRVRRARSAFA